jgi:hypothetical protein
MFSQAQDTPSVLENVLQSKLLKSMSLFLNSSFFSRILALMKSCFLRGNNLQIVKV